jgi:nucleolin
LKKPAAKAAPAKKAAKKDSSSDEDSDEESEEEKPKRKQSNVSNGKKNAKKEESDEEEAEEKTNGFEEVRGEDDDKKELFVGNLSFHTTEDSLAQAFGEYGTVTNVKLPQNNGQPKGFAFVEFATHKEAQAALDAYNG